MRSLLQAGPAGEVCRIRPPFPDTLSYQSLPISPERLRPPGVQGPSAHLRVSRSCSGAEIETALGKYLFNEDVGYIYICFGDSEQPALLADSRKRQGLRILLNNKMGIREDFVLEAELESSECM